MFSQNMKQTGDLIMNKSTLLDTALAETLSLFKKDVNRPLEIIKSIYSHGESQMSEGEWDVYQKKLPSFILENADSEDTVRNYLKDISILKDTVLQTALENESVSINNVLLVVKKIKEEVLQIACKQESTDLLDMLLAKDKALANFKMSDGSYILHFAFQNCCSADIVQTLIFYGSVCEAEDIQGRNILHYGALNPSEEVWNEFRNDLSFSKFLTRKDVTGKLPEDIRKETKE